MCTSLAPASRAPERIALTRRRPGGLDVGQRRGCDDVVRGVDDGRQVELLEDGIDGTSAGAAGVGPRDQVADLALGGDAYVDLAHAGDEAYVVQDDHVERVGEGDDQSVGGPADHGDAMRLGEAPGQQPDQLVVGTRLGQVDQGQAHEVGDARSHVMLGDQAEVDKDLAQPSAVRGCRSWASRAIWGSAADSRPLATRTAPSRRRSSMSTRSAASGRSTNGEAACAGGWPDASNVTLGVSAEVRSAYRRRVDEHGRAAQPAG